MDFKYNDGGRVATGNDGETNDCVARAISIVLGPNSYGLARVMVTHLKTDAGVDIQDTAFLEITHRLGFVYAQVPAGIFKLADLPKDGVFIAHTQNHVSAVIDGEVNDTFDPRGEVLKGYWLHESKKGYNVFKGDVKINRWPLNYGSALKMASLYYINYDRDNLITIKPTI